MAAIRMSGGLTIRHEVARTVKPAQTHADQRWSGLATRRRGATCETRTLGRPAFAGTMRQVQCAVTLLPPLAVQRRRTSPPVPQFADQLMLSEGGITLRM
jgi:hypothetical protein